MTTKRAQKNLTVMFTDISGFTRHTEQIGRDELMARIEAHNELLMPIVAHFDGRVVKTIGDAFLITFESPTNAVQCGLFMQHTLRKYNTDKPDNDQIHIKVSINSGEVTVTDNDVFGDPVNVAAKIEKATSPDEIYFTESVFLAMNKAEVPSSFVKTFRPRGAESQEIKLYKVAMDEEDARYRKIVDGTRIDRDKLKTRVLELSSVAEKEFGRYQDTLEALVTSQSASSRTTVLAIVGAAVILAAAILAGFLLIGGDNPEVRVIDSARAYLASGKPEDARQLLEGHIENHGGSPALTRALNEVADYEINRATNRAREMLYEGRPERVRPTLLAALDGGEPTAAQQQLLTRAQAYVDARQALAQGDAGAAARLAEVAAGDDGLGEDLDRLKRRIRSLALGRAILTDPRRIEGEYVTALEQMSAAFEADPTVSAAREWITRALLWYVYWEARKEGFVNTHARLGELRDRFPSVTEWAKVEAWLHLGGLWNYVTDRTMSGWGSWHDRRHSRHWEALRPAADADSDFSFRVGREVFEINRALGQTRTHEQYYLKQAIEKQPRLLEANRNLLVEMCRAWLKYDEQDDALGRELIRLHFFDKFRPELIEGLFATRVLRGEEEPYYDLRMNCFALLADRDELAVIDDPAGYFREHLREFVWNHWNHRDSEGNLVPQRLTHDQVRRLFALPMSLEDYRGIERLLNRVAEDARERQGLASVRPWVAETVQTMRAMLREEQPLHAATTE